jgi:hypothetical protein
MRAGWLQTEGRDQDGYRVKEESRMTAAGERKQDGNRQKEESRIVTESRKRAG